VVFAKRVFTIAGIYGLIVLLPLYFLERRIGEIQPPPITHPDFYYGFIGGAVAWQLVFLIIGRDPIRYRLLMLPAIVEKVTYGVAVLILLATNRIEARSIAGGVVDLVLAVFFALSFLKTSRVPSARD
jgi:hypothetical protein